MDDSVMDRRTFVGRTACSLLGVALAAVAQPTKIPRIGFLRTDRPSQDYIDAFEDGLREKGYTPGQNILIEYRFGRFKTLVNASSRLIARRRLQLGKLYVVELNVLQQVQRSSDSTPPPLEQYSKIMAVRCLGSFLIPRSPKQ